MSSYRIVHLTDLHVVEGLLHGVADPAGALSAVAEAVLESGADFAAVVVSGDLADRGDQQSYRRVRDVLVPLAQRLGAALVAVPGNHDDAVALATEFGYQSSYPHTTMVQGLRIVSLDSSVPGHHHGEIDEPQLKRLRHILATPAPDGTVLVLHHPPIESALPVFDQIGLRHRDRLADVLTGTDTRIVLAGHTHTATAGQMAGVPVWVGPAVAYAQDLVPPAGQIRSMAVHAFGIIDLTPGSAIASLAPLPTAPVVYQMDARRGSTLAAARADLSATALMAELKSSGSRDPAPL